LPGKKIVGAKRRQRGAREIEKKRIEKALALSLKTTRLLEGELATDRNEELFFRKVLNLMKGRPAENGKCGKSGSSSVYRQRGKIAIAAKGTRRA